MQYSKSSIVSNLTEAYDSVALKYRASGKAERYTRSKLLFKKEVLAFCLALARHLLPDRPIVLSTTEANGFYKLTKDRGNSPKE